MVQIRNVPDDLHRKLKARAALEGVSLSEYLLRELRKALERPTRAEMLERLGQPSRPPLVPSPAEVLREERERG
jgi:plasmid stability protein